MGHQFVYVDLFLLLLSWLPLDTSLQLESLLYMYSPQALAVRRDIGRLQISRVLSIVS